MPTDISHMNNYIVGVGNKNGTGSIQFGINFLATDLLYSRSLIDTCHLYGLPELIVLVISNRPWAS